MTSSIGSAETARQLAGQEGLVCDRHSAVGLIAITAAALETPRTATTAATAWLMTSQNVRKPNTITGSITG
jgi:threonine synthase